MSLENVDAHVAIIIVEGDFVRMLMIHWPTYLLMNHNCNADTFDTAKQK